MRVLKFGGTSVGSADRMQEVADIIEKNEGRQLIVLSAMSGTTNDLVSLSNHLKADDGERALAQVEMLEDKYVRILTDLFADKESRDKARALIRPSFQLFHDKLNAEQFDDVDEKEILAQGELISTNLFHVMCNVRGIESALIPALAFMRLQEDGEPNLEETAELLEPIMNNIDPEVEVIITQGYICRSHDGNIDNLRRGGSDYTATIVGSCLEVEEVQIWTDIDGVHNNDPRIIQDTRPIRILSYREAAELAYFGAKILHPTCVLPVEKANVPLRLKYTMAPKAPGTLISRKSSGQAITAIAAKDGITAIKIYSHRMLQAYGFLKRVFQVFEKYHTSVDMITTSEVAVSLTIDNTVHIEAITRELSSFSEVDITYGYTIVCVVGNALYDDGKHVHQVFTRLEGVPLRMVSMGGSKNNISLLVASEYKEKALRALHGLFSTQRITLAEGSSV